MQIEEPGAGRRFEEVLAERNDWPLPLAERVADEYCGFLYLAATAGFEVTPSEAVDQAWHLHLEWPHYQEVLCGEILGRPLAHRPGTGELDDEERYRSQYERTLALYEEIFGKPAPADIWPRPDLLEQEELISASETRERLGRRLALACVVGSLATLPFGALGIGFVLAGAALILFLASQPSVGAPTRDRRPGGCGAGCGGGGAGASSHDCGASCGGSSCGGGGCGGGGD